MTIAVRSLTAGLVGAMMVLSAVALGAQGMPQPRRPTQVPDSGVEGPAQTAPDEGVGARRLDALTNRSIEGLTFEYRDDGTIGLDLQGRFQNVLLATTRADGRVDVACSTDPTAHRIGSLPLWTPSRGRSAHRVPALTHLPAPFPVAPAPDATLEEK